MIEMNALTMNDHEGRMLAASVNYQLNKGKGHYFENQERSKPNIEDAISYYLDEDALKDAQIFIDKIIANKMKIKWSSVNIWSVFYKRKHACDIRVENGSWNVTLASHHLVPEVYRPKTSENMKWLVASLKNAITSPRKALQAS